MKKRNIYKDLVYLALGCILMIWLFKGADFWMQQRKTFVFTIKSDTELTESVVKELEKIAGLYEFSPMASCNVTLRLEEYTIDTVITGIDLKYYPLKWKSAETEIRKGNAPILFLGKDVFQNFADSNGFGPGKSQVSEWIEHYQELEVCITEESGQVARGKISGILDEPTAGIYMEKSQMQELYGKSAKMTGGSVKIQGEQNMQKAKEILEGGGFLVEEEKI